MLTLLLLSLPWAVAPQVEAPPQDRLPQARQEQAAPRHERFPRLRARLEAIREQQAQRFAAPPQGGGAERAPEQAPQEPGAAGPRWRRGPRAEDGPGQPGPGLRSAPERREIRAWLLRRQHQLQRQLEFRGGGRFAPPPRHRIGPRFVPPQRQGMRERFRERWMESIEQHRHRQGAQPWQRRQPRIPHGSGRTWY